LKHSLFYFENEKKSFNLFIMGMFHQVNSLVVNRNRWLLLLCKN
jgi:hypothetical protein